jgi:hypothetical protein
MKKSTKPSVGKLLRVLVAGGVALAGAGPLSAMADDPPAKTDKAATEKSGDAKKADADAKKKAGAEKEKEKKETEKKAEEAGGVKGW